MKSKSNSAIKDEAIPDIIKNKLERLKFEGRITNRKDFNLDKYLSIKANDNIKNKKIKVSLEVLSYSSFEKQPEIPYYAKIISEVLRIIVTDVKGTEIRKEGNFSCIIKATEVDQFCYPLLFKNNYWRIAEKFNIETDGICILDGEWNIVILIKEQPNEIISINPNGGIIYCELDKITNLRIPKGIFKEVLNCKIQFINIAEEIIKDFRVIYEEQLSPFIKISTIFLIEPINNNRVLVNDDQTFRRPISVKIPLPDWVICCLKEVNFDTKRTVQNQMKENLGFYFLEKVGDTWSFFENHLKFTQNSLGFDIKHFGKFVFVNCRQNREIRLCKNTNLIERLGSIEKGVILVFIYIKNQNWYLWIEAVKIDRILLVRERLQKDGFIFVEQTYDYIVEESTLNTQRMKRKLSRVDITKKDLFQRKTFELFENIQFELTIKGEIEKCKRTDNAENIQLDLKSKNDEKENNQKDSNMIDIDQIGKRKVVSFNPQDIVQEVIIPDLSYHSWSYTSNAIIVPIKPIERSLKEWTTIILEKIKKKSISEINGQIEREIIKIPSDSLINTDIDLSLLEPSVDDKFNSSKLSDDEKNSGFKCEIFLKVINPWTELFAVQPQKFEFYLSVEIMKDYFNVLTKEETDGLEIERKKLQDEEAIMESCKEEVKLKKYKIHKPKTVNYTRINVLSNPRTMNKGLVKDSKIISMKSLLALSTVVRQGLTLGVYLYLPENVIAGIGFDSLSQMSPNGINNTTYKILVTWKKMIHLNKIPEEIYVEQIMDALKMLNYENISVMVYNHWKNNQEISTDDCQKCMLQIKD